MGCIADIPMTVQRVLPLPPLVHGRTAEDVEAQMDNLMSSLGVDQRCKTATVAAASSKRSMASSVTHAEETLPANLSFDIEAKSQIKNSKKDREGEDLLNCSETGSLESMNLISFTYRRVKSAKGNELCYDISEKGGPGYHEKLITTEVSRKRNPSASECETNGNNPKEEEDIQSNKLTNLGLVIAPDWLCATTQQNTRQREVNGWLTHANPVVGEFSNSSAHSRGDSCEPVVGVIELISIKLAVINNCTKGSLPNYS